MKRRRRRPPLPKPFGRVASHFTREGTPKNAYRTQSEAQECGAVGVDAQRRRPRQRIAATTASSGTSESASATISASRRESGNMEGLETKGSPWAVQAYILIQSEIGSSEAVVLATRAVPGVLESFEVTGPYDVIVRCEAESVDDLGKFIVGRHPEGARHHAHPDLPRRQYLTEGSRGAQRHLALDVDPPTRAGPRASPNRLAAATRPIAPGVLENRGAGCG